MEENKVSVIIPVYNVEKYLDECIRSVVNQTYENIEIILVDDGSTDKSGNICDIWKECDERIIIIHKENGGLSSARNAGLDKAIGEYILFVDSDDTIDNNILEDIVPYMNKGYEIVSFGYRLIHEDGTISINRFNNRMLSFSSDEERISFLVGPFFRYETGWSVWNRIFLSSIIENYNLRFVDTKIVYAEDQLFCLYYLAHCKNMVVLNSIYYNYRQRKTSIMGQYHSNKAVLLGEKNEFAKYLLEYYKNWDDCEPFVRIFPLIHYLVMERLVQQLESIDRLSPVAIRETLYRDIEKKSDYEFFKQNMLNVRLFKKILYKNYNVAKAISKIIRAKGVVKNTLGYWLLVKIYHYSRNGNWKNRDFLT